MTRLMTTVGAATLLAIPALAQTPSADRSPGASGATIMPDSPSAKPHQRTQHTARPSDRSTGDAGSIEPAAVGKRKSAQRGDAESARVAELNRQQLQQVEGQQRR